jgi:hypothetical protein
MTQPDTKTSDTTLDVFNYSNLDKVNGQVKSTNPHLVATIRDPTQPSKLAVGPPFLPVALAGPYWVVATGPINETTKEYEWVRTSPLQKKNIPVCLSVPTPHPINIKISLSVPTHHHTHETLKHLDVHSQALISGGSPTEQGPTGKCVANASPFNPSTVLNGNGQGLWIFTRAQVADPRLVDAIRGVAVELGLDVEFMKPVVQEGCVYADSE